MLRMFATISRTAEAARSQIAVQSELRHAAKLVTPTGAACRLDACFGREQMPARSRKRLGLQAITWRIGGRRLGAVPAAAASSSTAERRLPSRREVQLDPSVHNTAACRSSLTEHRPSIS